jgi:hypothetical protein
MERTKSYWIANALASSASSLSLKSNSRSSRAWKTSAGAMVLRFAVWAYSFALCEEVGCQQEALLEVIVPLYRARYGAGKSGGCLYD